MYAIVDIETTGSYAGKHSITEVGIVLIDQNSIIEEFETLVNPGQEVPLHIQSLTGISNEMLVDAPTFDEVAPEIDRLLKDAVFVAHNVHFDYSFIKKAMQECGYFIGSKRLCTVRYARKVIKGLPSYSLGNLCHRLEITHEHAHRAMGDAMATVRLLRYLMDLDKNNDLEMLLKQNSGEVKLPVNVEKEVFDNLPEDPGVYYFLNNKGKAIYIGKAKNIKKRVASHFLSNTEKKTHQAFKQEIYDIDYVLTGSELLASLHEDHEIRHFWPRYNKAQKKPLKRFGILAYEDVGGNWRLGVQQLRLGQGALISFHQYYAARQWIFEQVEQYELSAKYCDLPMLEHLGTDVHEDDHNERFRLMLQELEKRQRSFAIVEHGRHEDEIGFVLIEEDKYAGIGFIDQDIVISSLEELKGYLEPKKSSSTAQSIVEQYLQKKKQPKIVWLEENEEE